MGLVVLLAPSGLGSCLFGCVAARWADWKLDVLAGCPVVWYGMMLGCQVWGDTVWYDARWFGWLPVV